MKIYNQQAANSNNSDQNIEFMFGETNNCHRIGNACLEYELKLEKDVAVAVDRAF